GPAAVEKRRVSFARGRGAAHLALRSLGWTDEPVLSGPNREPLWPNGMVGSISHAVGFGVAIAAPAADTDGVGVDIEQLGPVTELWEHVLRIEERTWIRSLDNDAKSRALIALFSAKESIYKAFFPRHRQFFGFETASLVPTSSGFEARLIDGFDVDYPSRRSFSVGCRWSGDLVTTWVVLPLSSRPEGAGAF
ncbi:MAG: 4'-phosphopantetheinyl transferase family protein, partial [Acidimicrobiia bacterium]